MKNKWAFRKADRDSIVLLIIVIVASVVLFPFLADKKDRKDSVPERRYKNGGRQDNFYAQQGENDGSAPAVPQCELFPFDPNTADSTQLLRLGLQPWQVRSIYKYRSKGGRFRKKEDFAKLYGLTLEKYQQLAPYIRIAEIKMAADYINADKNVTIEKHQEKTNIERSEVNGVRKLKYGETVDINTADTSELKRIPGIGSYYARRIVDLRQRLQSYTSKEELLKHIRNFPETALNYMTVSQNFPSIHINKVSQKELSRHPLFNYTQARDVIALRRTTGRIYSIEDMSLIPSISAAHLKKIKPYIIFE